MLDKPTIDYILNFYAHLMNLNEIAAIKHHLAHDKPQDALANDTSDGPGYLLPPKGVFSHNKEVLSLLTEGYEQFRAKTAERILNEHSGNIYFNNCPKCAKLARTPQAKQCRFCGHNWYKQIVANFQIASAFQVTGKAFFLLGEILTGEIKIGMKADLTTLGLGIKPTITAIEFARHHIDGVVWEDVALGVVDISEQDKVFLKSNSPFQNPILIEDPNAG